MNTSIDSLSIEINSVAKDSNTAVDLLIAKLDKLRTSLQNVIKEAENFSKLKDSIGSVSKSINTKTVTKANTRSTNNYGTESEQLYELLGVTDLENSKYAKLKSTIRTTNSELSRYITKNNELVTVSKPVKNAIGNVKVSVKTLGDASKNVTSLWGALTSEFTKSIVKIGAVYGLLKQLAGVIGSWVSEAANYEESMNLFMVTLGDRAEEANKWVEKFSNALYLDPSGVRQYMGSFNSLTKGLGVGADKAYLMSQNLTQLTYDLASFKNLSFDESFRKLQSAISGEIEPLRNVGVALSQATLQELALSMGIEKNVADMSEAEKAQLRYIQILKSTTEWQTDMGATLVTPANALRVLKQQFTLLSRALGSVFIPILMKIIPYVMVLTQALTKLANKIAAIFGYKIQDVDYGRISTGLGGISDNIEDIGDNAADATKKLNTMLAPFDELNVVQNQSEKAGKGSGLGDIGDDLGLALDGYDALARLNDGFKKDMAEAEAILKRILPIVAAIGVAFAAWKIAKTVDNFLKTWKEMNSISKLIARIGFSIAFTFLGFELTKEGNKDVLSEKTLLKGIAEQFLGSSAFGIAAGMLTKNVQIGVFVSLAVLGFSGSKTASHGDWKNGITGFLEQGISVAGIAGLAFKMSGGNPVITLGVTAAVTWANVLFDTAELAKMKPTWEELYNAIFIELNPFKDLGYAIGDLVTDWSDAVTDMTDNATDFFTNLGYNVGDGITAITDLSDSIIDFATEGVKNLGDFAKQSGDKLSTWWKDTKKGFGETWEDLKTKSSEAFENTKTTISTKLEDAKNNVSNKLSDIKISMNNAWDNIKNGASEKLENVKTTITDKWTKAKTWLSNNIGDSNFWKNKFNSLLSGASNVLNSLRDKFANWKATLKMPHISWDSNGFKTSGALKKVLETLHLPTTLPKINVQWYAEGGFPKDGEFFVANESGPEMIGKIGNKSAVANNEQIEASLTNALLTALNNYDFGSDKSPTTIYIGNKKVYEGYGDYVNSENDRYGTNTIRI